MNQEYKLRENRTYNIFALEEIASDGSRNNLAFKIHPGPFPGHFEGPDWYKNIAHPLVLNAVLERYNIELTSEYPTTYLFDTKSPKDKFAGRNCGVISRVLTSEEMNRLAGEIVAELSTKKKSGKSAE